nr:hypothetical protein [Ferrovum sp.]
MQNEAQEGLKMIDELTIQVKRLANNWFPHSPDLCFLCVTVTIIWIMS